MLIHLWKAVCGIRDVTVFSKLHKILNLLLQVASILVLFLTKLHFSWKAYEDMMTQESTEVQSPHSICQILNRTNFLYLIFLWSFKTPFSLLTQQICSLFSRASIPISFFIQQICLVFFWSFKTHTTHLFSLFPGLQYPFSLLTQQSCSVCFGSSDTIFLVHPTNSFSFFFWSSKSHSL